MTTTAKTGLTTTNEFSTVTAREVDFVSRFTDNWEALQNILGITRPIRKSPGTRLVSYKTVVASEGGLQGGTSVGEGEVIPKTKFSVIEAGHDDIQIGKYSKSVSIEAIQKYGADVAIEKTDDQFLTELQNKVLNDFYTFVKTGTLRGKQKTWQRALAVAKGSVLEKFQEMNKSVTDVVGFANTYDLYDYLGDQNITIQSAFGLQYVTNFLGYSTLFLLPEALIPSKTVIAVPVENIDLYYIDPSDSDFVKAGLEYTVQGETNLLGFHVQADYERATGDAYAVMGLKLWAEYLDGICVVEVKPNDDNVKPVVPDTESA